MSKYKGLFTFDENNHRYVPIAQADGIIDTMDYEPDEPLIKDKKIRKAVKIWADASGITKVMSYGDIFWLGFRSVNTESVWQFECFYTDASEFKLDKEYTITELCGEEEND